MKVGFLINYFYPMKGGAENNCFYLARELAKNNEVHVFTSQIKGTKKYEVINKIHVHRYKTFFRYKYYLSFTPGLLRAILKEDLDILHIHSLGFIWHDKIMILKKLTSKTKIVNTPHGPFMALKNYNFFAKIFKLFLEKFERFFINRFYDAVIQVNPLQYKWLTKQGIKKNKVHFVPNGIDELSFKKINNKSFIKKYNLKDKFVISYLGRVQNYKGLDQVIKILPDLGKNIIFLIMGKDAGDLSRLKKLAIQLDVQNRVRFTGEISDNEVLEGLSLSKIFILPSEWEAFGISILQAMAQSNVIISTKTDGGRFLISKENGFLYDYSNLNDLESKIKLLYKNRNLLNQLGKNNIKKAKQFLWKDIAKDLEKIYRKLK